MFERRLKILLLVLVIASLALVGRAFQIQGIQRNYWRQQVSSSMTHVEYLDTTRGRILDRLGRILAEDIPSIDACIDYRAITPDPDPKWLKSLAQKNLHAKLKDDAPAMVQEKARIHGQIIDMWADLARISGKTPEEISEIRRGIQQKVQMRQMYVNYRNDHAIKRDSDSDNWYDGLLSDNIQDSQTDKGEIETVEQRQPYVIVSGLSTDQQVELARNSEKYPGFSLQPSKHRYYPFGQSACHVLGMLGPVGSELQNDPFGKDELQKYKSHDLIGRGGVEALCEKTLRGYRGRVEKMVGSEEIISSTDPVPGRDVRLSIDIELQSDLEHELIRQRKFVDKDTLKEDYRADEHGAIVIVKIDTGEVLAMASNPGFDPNTLADKLPMLIVDDLNLPMLNRGTEMSVEPGSTVKVMVASGALTDKIVTPETRILCRGILTIDDRPLPFGHCWTYSYLKAGSIPIASHNLTARLPPGTEAFHDDMLSISDGLEQSCNVVFGTVGYKMGIYTLSDWFNRFGLGRPTGVGIRESSGRLYRPSVDNNQGGYLACSAAIGEGVVQATPIQMANVAATIGRNGIWMRPQLVSIRDFGRATTKPSPDLGPDRVDMHISPEALQVVQHGMWRVCNSGIGTGRGILPEKQPEPRPDDPTIGMQICGKTGTAQTAQLSKPMRDPVTHQIMLDDHGKTIFERVPLGTKGTETWYKSADGHFQHAWFIGYAPADHPQVAFCVMVEYGEAGGRVAGAIAHDALVACCRHGYLVPNRSETVTEPTEIH